MIRTLLVVTTVSFHFVLFPWGANCQQDTKTYTPGRLTTLVSEQLATAEETNDPTVPYQVFIDARRPAIKARVVFDGKLRSVPNGFGRVVGLYSRSFGADSAFLAEKDAEFCVREGNAEHWLLIPRSGLEDLRGAFPLGEQIMVSITWFAAWRHAGDMHAQMILDAVDPLPDFRTLDFGEFGAVVLGETLQLGDAAGALVDDTTYMLDTDVTSGQRISLTLSPNQIVKAMRFDYGSDVDFDGFWANMLDGFGLPDNEGGGAGQVDARFGDWLLPSTHIRLEKGSSDEGSQVAMEIRLRIDAAP